MSLIHYQNNTNYNKMENNMKTQSEQLYTENKIYSKEEAMGMLTNEYWRRIYNQNISIKNMFGLCEHISKVFKGNQLIAHDVVNHFIILRINDYYKVTNIHENIADKTKDEYMNILIADIIKTDSPTLMDYVYRTNSNLPISSITNFAHQVASNNTFKWSVDTAFSGMLERMDIACF